jgi:predicted aspartyl protease
MVTLSNEFDELESAHGKLDEKSVRSVSTAVMVDTGSMKMVINESICQKLGLKILRDSSATLAGGERKPCKIAEQMRVTWRDRYFADEPIVFPDGGSILMGVLPLEAMDLRVNPVSRKLEGAHGDKIVHYVL